MKSNKIGFTCGAFDLFHAGHVLMLKEAKQKCDYLIVGLHTDPTIDRPNKNKPIQTVEERKIQLEGSKYVDAIVVYDTEADLVNLLKKIKPDIRIKGSDWEGQKHTGDELVPVYFHQRNHNYSSTELRQRIANSL